MQLLLLATGLSLFSAVQAALPSLAPARAEELPGTWYMIRWAGDMPIPDETKNHPMPPFTLRINNQNKLEFRMNLMKPIGCIEFKLPLDAGTEPGTFVTRWKHTIYIYFLPGRTHAIAYFQGYMNYMYYQMMMVMAHSLDEDPKILGLFQEFVDSKNLKTNELIDPPRTDACKLARET
ncbi:PREDICTED: von Ebner gland protein 1-like [Chinchilla lanigera]|uniref:von Ebner gland protein 1-like n=1 Tax=Chinchilla lanigera TaxID=34839 RepID=UPI00038EEAED|nr:PREDICTED: von Ebner gland protein 1-like [Chinchilla lanigera]